MLPAKDANDAIGGEEAWAVGGSRRVLVSHLSFCAVCCLSAVSLVSAGHCSRFAAAFLILDPSHQSDQNAAKRGHAARKRDKRSIFDPSEPSGRASVSQRGGNTGM